MILDCRELTFCISLFIDSENRINNLDIVIQYIQNSMNTNIVICETGEVSKIKDRYSNINHIFCEDSSFFNRQKYLNVAVRNAKTDYFIHFDSDVIISSFQIFNALQLLKEDKCDIVYPYDGKFYNVPKNLHSKILNYNNESIDLCQCRLVVAHSVGGAVMFKKKVFWDGGGANEFYRGLGYEDNDLDLRFHRLGYRFERTNNVLLHLDHVRKETSFEKNKYIGENYKEFSRMSVMTKEQFQEEIKTWEWCKNV